MYLIAFGAWTIAFIYNGSFKYKNQYYRFFHDIFTVAIYLMPKLCSNKETVEVGSYNFTELY
jgi:hypothetical protein